MSILHHVLEKIELCDAKHGQKLRAHVEAMGPVFFERANEFLSRYERFLVREGWTLDFAVESYIALLRSMLKERMMFIRTGKYSSSSFAEVNQRVYNNPQIMGQHMHGLAVAQFLWPDQYQRFSFFCDVMAQYARQVGSYLEIGGGHALYVNQAAQSLPGDATIDVVDISPSSIAMARGIADDARIHYHCTDIRVFAGNRRFDFITMGEVLEHVEDPRSLLRDVRNLLKPSGRLFLTTPANAPMIDHIWLFHNEQEIRAMLGAEGLQIEQECLMYSDGESADIARKKQLPLMYAALLTVLAPTA